MLVPELGNGTTITFGTSGFTAEVLGIEFSGIGAREAVDTTHFGSTEASSGEFGGRTFIPTKLNNPGTVSVEIHFDADTRPPTQEAIETITFTFPQGTGESTPSDWEGQGFSVSFSASLVLDGKCTGTLELQLSGVWTVTAAT